MTDGLGVQAPGLRDRDFVQDPRLAWTGLLLAVGELFCVGRLWHVRADRTLAHGGEPLCWPMWSGCAAWRVFDQSTLTVLLIALAAAAVAAGVAFLRRWRGALPLLAGTMLVLIAVELQDFRLRQNQFYMLAIAVAFFTVLPDPGRALRHLVVQFYFWAGLLKLNREWLTGAALYRPVWLLDGPLLHAACAWVVVLELVVVWGLLSRRRWLFVFTVFQIGLFSLASVAVVGSFYPALMMLLVTACAVLRRDNEPPLFIWRERTSTQVAIGLFCALQLIPRLMPGDPAITGEGRLFALHMFDAKVVCDSRVIVLEGGQVVREFDATVGLPVRTACDPAVLYARGRTMCRHLGDRGTINLHLASRRSTDDQLRPVVELTDFCHQMPAYRWWRHNEWIRVD